MKRHHSVPRSNRPRKVPTRLEMQEMKRNSEERDRHGTTTRIDEFIRVDVPMNLRGNPGIHNVGHIEVESGDPITLIRCDFHHGPSTDGRLRGPAISLMRVGDERTVDLVAMLTPPAAGALAILLRDGSPTMLRQSSSRNDELAAAKGGSFLAPRVDAVTMALPPQQVTPHTYLVGFVSTAANSQIALLRRSNGRSAISLSNEFAAHLSAAATEALVQVLEDFAIAHGADPSSIAEIAR